MQVVCATCGLRHVSRDLHEGERGRCAQCDSIIYDRKRGGIDHTLAFCIAGLLLFLPACVFPIMTFTVVGRWNDSYLPTGFLTLFEQRAYLIGTLVMVASVVAPVARFSLGIALLLPIKLGYPRASSPRLQKIFDGMTRWTMLDVYLLAVVVAYAKLGNFGESSVDPGMYLLLALIVLNLLVTHTYDSQTVTQIRHASCAIDPLSGAPRDAAPSFHHKSFAATQAFLVAAIILFIPSYVLPVLRIVEYGDLHEATVYGAVLELTDGGQYLLGGLIFTASILVPILKIATLSLLVISIRRKWTILKRERMILFKIVEPIGRWSFVDLFVVSLLVGLAELGVFATASPGPGLAFFGTVVVLTMLAAWRLDPKLIWNPDGS